MSCSVECIVAIFTIPKLLAVIQAMAAVVAEQATSLSNEDSIKVKQDKEIIDCVGNKIPVDLVLQNTHGDRIGIKAQPPKDGPEGVQEQPLEFVFEDKNSKTAKKTVDKIRQAYARIQILSDLKRKGYQNVKEEKLPNGAIRLVVQKWQ